MAHGKLIKDAKGLYTVSQPLTEKQLLEETKKLLSRKFRRKMIIASPNQVKEYLTFKYSEEEREIFSVLFLNNRHSLLACEEIFQGTVDGASVWAREIVKRALAHNAAAVILVHNHPSGTTEYSEADRRITKRIQEALSLVDVRVLDHLIIAGYHTFSFAEAGIL